MTSAITIHIIEAADGKLTVCTTAASPKPGERLRAMLIKVHRCRFSNVIRR